jgi:hypothetical protein
MVVRTVEAFPLFGIATRIQTLVFALDKEAGKLFKCLSTLPEGIKRAACRSNQGIGLP